MRRMKMCGPTGRRAPALLTALILSAALVPVALVPVAIAPIAMAPVAMAHSDEVSSDPAADSVLAAMPSQVSVTFNEPLVDAGAALVVTSPAGTVVSADAPVIEDRTIRVDVSDGGEGTYQVAYRVVSGDGHPVSGTYVFSVGSPSAPAPGTQQESSPATGAMSPLVISLAAIASIGALIVVVVAAMRLRRR